MAPPLRRSLEWGRAELDLLVLGREVRELASMVIDGVRRAVPPDYPWPGNVREVEQAVRRVLVPGRYGGEELPSRKLRREALLSAAEGNDVEARRLQGAYCRPPHGRQGTWEEVARGSGLDCRTARKYEEDLDRG